MKYSEYLLSALALCTLSLPALAQDWHFLTYNPPTAQKFISYTGHLLVPPIPRPGTYYLWPGLQATDNSGVFQPVLDGRTGGWYFGSGWCCSNPSLPWGGGFGAVQGDRLGWNYTLSEGEGVWKSMIENERSGAVAMDDFPLADKTFNQALFAIELYDVPWDFGPLVFNDIQIIATGTDPSWCNPNPSNYNGATRFSMTEPRAIVGEDRVTCVIERVTLEGPV